MIKAFLRNVWLYLCLPSIIVYCTGTRKLVRVRSTSLDSISTALSFGTGPQSEVPSRASSLDNLHMAQFHSGHSRSTRSNGRRYMLLDNESVASSIIGGDSGEGKSLDVREPPSSTQPKLPLTRTKSDPLSSRSVRVKEPDTFSDNFVNVESNKELERPRSLIESPSTSQVSTVGNVCALVCDVIANSQGG